MTQVDSEAPTETPAPRKGVSESTRTTGRGSQPCPSLAPDRGSDLSHRSPALLPTAPPRHRVQTLQGAGHLAVGAVLVALRDEHLLQLLARLLLGVLPLGHAPGHICGRSGAQRPLHTLQGQARGHPSWVEAGGGSPMEGPGPVRWEVGCSPHSASRPEAQRWPLCFSGCKDFASSKVKTSPRGASGRRPSVGPSRRVSSPAPGHTPRARSRSPSKIRPKALALGREVCRPPWPGNHSGPRVRHAVPRSQSHTEALPPPPTMRGKSDNKSDKKSRIFSPPSPASHIFRHLY